MRLKVKGKFETRYEGEGEKALKKLTYQWSGEQFHNNDRVAVLSGPYSMLVH